MKKFLPKPLFIAILLISISIIGVSALLASNSGPNVTQKGEINTAKPKSKTASIPLSNSALEQPAAQENPAIEPTPTPEPITETKAVEKRTSPAATPKPQTVNTATTSATKLCSGSLTTKFLCLLNEYRATKKLGTLTYSNSLASVATKHSSWMNSAQTLAHINAEGVRHDSRCELAGITCRAENLAQGISDAEELLSEWKKSGSHNVNLLGPYSTIGLGISGDYITLLFN